MGIQNLLKFLKPLTRPAHISEWAGMTVGVDAMGWMHRGAIACAIELLKGEETDKFLRFIIHMIMLFKYHRVEPLLVFDGAKIPAKEAEDEKRRQLRAKAAEEARTLLKKNEEARRRGQKPPVDDRELLTKCSQSVSISSDMVDSVIAACRLLGVPFLVAPLLSQVRPASSQLKATTSHHSGTQAKLATPYAAAVSEDSDLLAHGCLEVLFKLDKEGNCERLHLPLKNGQSCPASSVARDAPGTAGSLGQLECLRAFTQEMFTAMCVLGGCDYTHDVHIHGLGVNTACKFIHKLGTLERVIRYLFSDNKWKKKLTRSFDEVLQGHQTAMVAFTHHRVFDVRTDSVVSACVAVEGAREPRGTYSQHLFEKARQEKSREGNDVGLLGSERLYQAKGGVSSTDDTENKHPNALVDKAIKGSSASEDRFEGDDKEKKNTRGGEEDGTRKKDNKKQDRRGGVQDDRPLYETTTGRTVMEEDGSIKEAEIEKIVGIRQSDFHPIATGHLNPRTHQPRIGRLNRKERVLVEEYRSRALQRVHQSHTLAAARRYRNEQLKQETATAQAPPACLVESERERKTTKDSQEETEARITRIDTNGQPGIGITQATVDLERFVASNNLTSSPELCAVSQSRDTTSSAVGVVPTFRKAASLVGKTGQDFKTKEVTTAVETEKEVHVRKTTEYDCKDGNCYTDTDQHKEQTALDGVDNDVTRNNLEQAAASLPTPKREPFEARDGQSSVPCFRAQGKASVGPVRNVTGQGQIILKEKEERTRLVLIKGQKQRGGQTKLGFLSSQKETRRIRAGTTNGRVQERASEEDRRSPATDASPRSEQTTCFGELEPPNKKMKTTDGSDFARFSSYDPAETKSVSGEKKTDIVGSRRLSSFSQTSELEMAPRSADPGNPAQSISSTSTLSASDPVSTPGDFSATCLSSSSLASNPFSSTPPVSGADRSSPLCPPSPAFSYSPASSDSAPLPSSSCPSSSPSDVSSFSLSSVFSSFAFNSSANTAGDTSKRKSRKKFGEGFQAASTSGVSWNLGSSADSRSQTPSPFLSVAQKSFTSQKRATG
ncbi:xpg n-terminal domain-containing protein [Cystoisospora suis]|uniref:Exonuclease 1 n=1 Tax=Cystoisospora suis TaxID=483139 RepID=A0A2C6KJZ6_9APIC|nr:xpg n-terminal domain-containing protein [Cystoisospora suis]